MIFAMSGSRATTLVFHSGALGDFVLTWPLALALQKAYPDTTVTYVTHTSKGQLAARFLDTGYADADSGGWHTLYGETSDLSADSLRLLTSAESCFYFAGKNEDQFCNNLRLLVPGVPVSVLSAVPESTFIGHITAYYAHQLFHSTIKPFYIAALKQIVENGLPVMRGSSSRVLLHPGAGASRKCWPLESYLQLAIQLREVGHETTMLLGEAELERYPQRVMDAVRETVTVKTPRTYVDLAEELLDAKLLITNDNGPGHLAAVLGGTVLSLFGPSNATLWRPIGPGAHLIESEMLGALPPARVMTRVLELTS